MISDYLEPIALNNAVASFSRLYANSVRYHHWHQCLEVLYIEEGFGVVMVDNRQYTMRPGRLFFFPPFTLHKIRVDDAALSCYRRTIIHVDQRAIGNLLRDFPQNLATLQQLATRGNPAFVADLAAIHDQVDQLFSRYAHQAGPHGLSGEQVTCMLIALFSLLPSRPTPQVENHTGIASPVMFWLEEHYQQKFSLDALARDLGKSRSWLSRRFHAETGEPIHVWLNTLRLRKACELLVHGNAPVSEIAARVGFSEVTWFISSFKKGIGETPLRYRKRATAGLPAATGVPA